MALNIIISIYKELLKVYGPQGWWPLSGLNRPVKKEDKDWGNYLTFIHIGEDDFKINWPRHLGIKPEKINHKFEIITGSILTQNTSWANVERALYNLNKHDINTIDKIKEVSREELALLIKNSGFHNQKSQNLKLLADYFVCNENFEKILNKKTEDLRKELLSLKGIGKETADSIILYSAEKPVFVIDAYTKRIFSRILGIDNNKYDYWQEYFMKSFTLKDDRVSIFKEYHALIVKHGKEACKTDPLCEICFLKKKCNYGKK